MADAVYDVAVVGAGMLGAATAYRLSRSGMRVVVVDEAAAARRATGNTFAWLNAVSKEPEAYHRLNAAGMEEHRALAAELGGDCWRFTGALEWAGDDAGRERLAAKVQRLAGRGYAARLIDRQELAALEPGIEVRDGSERFAYYERDGWVEAPVLVRMLLNRVGAAGGEVREGVPLACPHGFVRAATSTGRVEGLEVRGGRLAVGAVVLCAGTATAELARDLGFALPVERRPGLLAVTTVVPPGTLGRVVYPPGFHVRPDVNGGLRIGADDIDETVTEETPPAPVPAGAETLLARVKALLPAAARARIDHARVGVRPVPADGVTVAGRLPGWENVYLAVTHSGITLGPLLGRLLAQEITTGVPDPQLATFRPERIAAVR